MLNTNILQLLQTAIWRMKNLSLTIHNNLFELSCKTVYNNLVSCKLQTKLHAWMLWFQATWRSRVRKQEVHSKLSTFSFLLTCRLSVPLESCCCSLHVIKLQTETRLLAHFVIYHWHPAIAYMDNISNNCCKSVAEVWEETSSDNSFHAAHRCSYQHWCHVTVSALLLVAGSNWAIKANSLSVDYVYI